MLRETQARYVRVEGELRAVCEAASEREVWWRRGVEALELDMTDRDAERNCLLESAQAEWARSHAEMRGTADAASRQVQDHVELIEVQSARLLQVENHADREYASLLRGVEEAQRDHLALSGRLVLPRPPRTRLGARRPLLPLRQRR